MKDKYADSIDNNLGWIAVMLFCLLLATCVQEEPKVTVTVDQCNGSYEVIK